MGGAGLTHITEDEPLLNSLSSFPYNNKQSQSGVFLTLGLVKFSGFITSGLGMMWGCFSYIVKPKENEPAMFCKSA